MRNSAKKVIITKDALVPHYKHVAVKGIELLMQREGVNNRMDKTVKYPAMPSHFLKGEMPLTDKTGNQVAKLEDFWSWAYSDLLGNTERGALAEYIVACSMGIQNKARIAWDKYDLLSAEGIAIEVKTSGYLQTWEQEDLSKIIFGIQPTLGWDSRTNEYGLLKKRQADIYVFCVHNHIEQETVNPLDLKQWDFYLLPTKVLNEKVGKQKSITLSSLLNAGAIPCEYEDLHEKIVELVVAKEELQMTQVEKMIFDEGMANGEAKVVAMIRKKNDKGLVPADIAKGLELDKIYVDRVVHLIGEDTGRTDLQVAEILVEEGR